MINLAGRKDCDDYIRRELAHARIPVIQLPSNGEVPSSIGGRLGSWTFRRAWYYYIAESDGQGIPIEKARELWADPCGHDDVRVGGHCGCPSPDEYGGRFFDKDGLRLYVDKDGSQMREYKGMARSGDTGMGTVWRFTKDLKADATCGFVVDYHVDSVLGLRLLADAIAGVGL